MASFFLVKFLTQSFRDKALNPSSNVLPNIPVSFTPWSIHTNSVYTLSEEGFWIRLEGIPQHLWSVNLFYKMIANFAELLEVHFSNDNARYLGYARLKVRLHLGKDLPDLRYFSYARDVYPIRYSRV